MQTFAVLEIVPGDEAAVAAVEKYNVLKKPIKQNRFFFYI